MKKKFGFHIVKEKKDPTEEIADDIIDELQDSQNPMREMELKIKAHRYRFFSTGCDRCGICCCGDCGSGAVFEIPDI